MLPSAPNQEDGEVSRTARVKKECEGTGRWRGSGQGNVSGEVAGPLGGLDDRRELMERLVGRPAEETPAMARVLGELAGEELPVDFEFGLDVILAGLDARLRASSR